jgi:predicted nucleic acid-binding protein
MVSADAGIWLAYFNNEPAAANLRKLLDQQRVAVHPLVLIELQLGLRASQRKEILSDLRHLVATEIEPPEVVSAFIEERGLARFQIGVTGAHLLASAVRHGDQLWASDRDLRAAAIELAVAYPSSDR